MSGEVRASDPAGRFLEVPSGAVFVVEEGPPDGPVCLLVHGAPGSVRDFRYLAPRLAARGVRAVRVDMPGFGNTPLEVWPAQSARARAAFVRNVARLVGGERYALLGHSIGGSACLVAAGVYPAEVCALALVSSVGTSRHRGMRMPEGVARAATGALALPGVAPALVDAGRALMRAGGFRGSDVDELDADKLRLYVAIAGGLDFALHRACARSVACPTLVVSAEDDPLVEPRAAHALADALAGPALHRHLHVAAGGHYLQKHAAADIALHVAEMLLPVVV